MTLSKAILGQCYSLEPDWKLSYNPFPDKIAGSKRATTCFIFPFLTSQKRVLVQLSLGRTEICNVREGKLSPTNKEQLQISAAQDLQKAESLTMLAINEAKRWKTVRKQPYGPRIKPRSNGAWLLSELCDLSKKQIQMYNTCRYRHWEHNCQP